MKTSSKYFSLAVGP